ARGRPRHEDDEPLLLRDAVAAPPEILDREPVDLAEHDGGLRSLGFDDAPDGDRPLRPARFADEEGESSLLAEVRIGPLALRADDVLLGVLPDPLRDLLLRDAGLEDASGQIEDAGAAELPCEVADEVGALAPQDRGDLLKV